MKIFKKQPATAPLGDMDTSDAGLVMASLGGNHKAFSQIVARYQNLLCSIAYSSVGDLKHSEDIAQETFIEAWKKLDSLNDPEKLKSWLCGILRFKASHFRRKEATLPIAGADELDEQGGGHSESTQMEDEVISAQEQALLWQVLKTMPQTYREPLILFYREHHSVESVARQLDLSEDTVKQRLSRGRKLLQTAMVTFVENTLSKTNQGAVFTLAVKAAISSISPPVKAAGLGAGAVKTGSLFKGAGIFAILASLSGLVSSYFGLKAALDQSRTQRERRHTIKYVALFFSVALVYVASMFALKYFAQSDVDNTRIYIFASQLLVVGFVITYIILVLKLLRGGRTLRAQERMLFPEAFQGEADQRDSKQREYKSDICFAGVPLIHVRFGAAEQGDKPLYGWIAGGDYAVGLLFAWGGFAIAPISVGIFSFGLISVGAVGLGLLGLGTIAIGFISFGASAIGYKAYASLSALGWNSAVSGGFSVAKEAAIGPVAAATHINNQQAAAIANLSLFGQSYLWVLAALSIMVIVPAAWHAKKVRQRMGKN